LESKIHQVWRLEKAELDEGKKQRSLTGPFIERCLGNKEVEIIRNDSVQLVENIKSQHYTAVEVAKAYCHTAAIAQQIVSKAILAILLQLALLPPIGRYTQPNQDSF
jgi:amidase